MDTLLKLIQKVNTYLSDYVLVVLLGGTGIFFTFRTGFVQLRYFKEGMRNLIGGLRKKDTHTTGISSFQALSTAIAAQVGTGNIIGASGAILTGGPGALLWMWIIAFFGMATSYAEAVLSQETKKVHPNKPASGGPVYYIKKAFPNSFGIFLSKFFALATVLSLGFMGAMVQSNAISATAKLAFGIPPHITGIAVSLGAFVIFIGGINRIAAVSEKIVPLMAAIYIAIGVIILCIRAAYLPEAFSMIIKYAFKPAAIIGGGVGSALKTAITQGVKRGLFSNEAGMGSTPHAHAVANVKKPHDQGVAAMVGVFIDTFIVLTITGLTIVSTLYAGKGPLSPYAIPQAAEGITPANMMQISLGNTFGNMAVGSIMVAVCLFFFAFSSIISWNYFGKINADYLWGKKFSYFYTITATVFIILGSILSASIVWELADLFNQLMVLPNVLALWALSSVVAKAAKK